MCSRARGPSWQRPNWPQPARGELVSALDGDWHEVEKAVGDKIKARAQGAGVELSTAEVQQATRDSIHALMLIRAYRARGHFHANLDPLGLEPHKDEEDLDPRSYGFTDADMDRPIFLDKVLGLEFATLREILAILRRTYCQTLGVEFMHISDPAQKGWMQERIEGPDKEITFTPEGKRAILNKLIEAEGLREILRPEVHRHQALRPRRRRVDDPGAGADHQARRRARREGDRASAWRIAAGSTCWRR